MDTFEYAEQKCWFAKWTDKGREVEKIVKRFTFDMPVRVGGPLNKNAAFSVYRYPICARCGREVEKVLVDEDNMRDLIIFRFYCHGKVEGRSVRCEEIVSGGPDYIRRFLKAIPPFSGPTEEEIEVKRLKRELEELKGLKLKRYKPVAFDKNCLAIEI